MLAGLTRIPDYFLQPIRLFQSYDRHKLRPDLMAGLTLAVILLPLAIAFALIAELPPKMGLYTAIVGAIVGALWGSSNQTHTGPTNALSLLVLSVLLTVATPGTPEFVVAAGMMAVMVGIFQLVMGLARLGVLVNFVSHSVIVGFSAGAGVLIIVKQLQHLLGLEFSSHSLMETFQGILTHLPLIHWPTLILGLGVMVLIVGLRKLNPKLPGPLISMIVISIIAFFLGLDKAGVKVIGQLPTNLPPLAKLPLFDLNFIARLSTGAFAVGSIGLVTTTSVARSIATQTGQRLRSNQEFVGLGLANIAVGFLSGYPCAGSFSISAVNFKAGAQTRLSSIFAGLFVLIAMLILAPLAVHLPRTALAGVLIITGYGMIDKAEMARIWWGTRGDAFIMLATFLGTLFLHIEFAVLLGILLSFAYYILKSSIPRVFAVSPDANFKHFVQQQPHHPSCPQLGILKISGDLYFGAVSHIEETTRQHLADHPEQRFLLLRMHGVNQADLTGVQMLESIASLCRERGGDLFLMRVQEPVYEFMQSAGFCDKLGYDHFLPEDNAIAYLFHRILDPAICIYECYVRVFEECQNLPKQTYLFDMPLQTYISSDKVVGISPQELQQTLNNSYTPSPLVIDVRQPREFKQGHIPQAQLIPLPKILSDTPHLSNERKIVLVCRSGWRSARATCLLQDKGHQNVRILEGGMVAWEAAGFPEATDYW